jgi:hypothetical protein
MSTKQDDLETTGLCSRTLSRKTEYARSKPEHDRITPRSHKRSWLRTLLNSPEPVNLCPRPLSRKSKYETMPTELELDDRTQSSDRRGAPRKSLDSLGAVDLCYQSTSRKSGHEAGQTELELDEQAQLSDKRSWLRTLLFQTACFLWLLPMVALLVLNFKNHIVGASAWCPYRDCYVGWFNPVGAVPLQNLRDFDKQSHNLLGALQFVAKALEIWFELIFVALVYLVTFSVAGNRDGLPIAYLTRPSEFSDLPGIFDPLLWMALPGVSRARDNARRYSYRLRIYLFISFTILLCILCNLMGPATAVLTLPNLQWLETPLVGNRIFGTLNSGSAPTWNSSGPLNNTACNETQIEALEFSCANSPFASQLYLWIESYLASGTYYTGVTQDNGLRFSLNQTFIASTSNALNQSYSDVTWWAPSRQVLSGLNEDYLMASNISVGYDVESLKNLTGDALDTYVAYNHSVQLNIQRNGPTIGAIVQYHGDHDNTTTSTSIIDDNLEIRCYGNYHPGLSSLIPDEEENYTKCVRAGDGWGTGNKRVAFTISGVQDNTPPQSA